MGRSVHRAIIARIGLDPATSISGRHPIYSSGRPCQQPIFLRGDLE
jgi:hypothetical protein